MKILRYELWYILHCSEKNEEKKISFYSKEILVYIIIITFTYVEKVHVFVLNNKYGILKRYLRIDQHLARYFVYYVEYLSSLPPFLCSQIITPLPNSMVSINQEGVEF